MLDVKQAAQAALEYFLEFYSEQPFTHVLLEEVERAEEDRTPYWLITLGYSDESGQSAPKSTLARWSEVTGTSPHPRRYKQFKINAESGQVEAMKIRVVEHA